MELGFERLGISDRDCLCSWLIYVNELSNVPHVRILFIINVHFFFVLALTATSVRMQQALPSNKQERKGKERKGKNTRRYEQREKKYDRKVVRSRAQHKA